MDEEDSNNNFLYNAANELNTTSGWYDMFYRNYDPSLGRMMQVDPYATSYSSHSTYNYAMNNPVFFNDPNGGQAAAPPGVSVSGYNRMLRLTGRTSELQDFSTWYEDGDSGSGGGQGQYASFWNAVLSLNPGNYKVVSKRGQYGYFENTIKKKTFDLDGQLLDGVVLGQRFVPLGLRDPDNPAYPNRTFEVLHSANDSFGWDWFLETTQHSHHYYTQTAVIIVYNTNKKDWGTSEYGKEIYRFGRTRSLVMDASGLHPHQDLPYNPSQLMKDFIQGARDYHCGGCLSEATLMENYINYLLSPDPNARNPFIKKPRKLTGNGVHR